jgi:hypothetical protein
VHGSPTPARVRLRVQSAAERVGSERMAIPIRVGLAAIGGPSARKLREQDHETLAEPLYGCGAGRGLHCYCLAMLAQEWGPSHSLQIRSASSSPRSSMEPSSNAVSYVSISSTLSSSLDALFKAARLVGQAAWIAPRSMALLSG